MNAEELIKLDPDVVLYASGVPEDLEVATQAGITASGGINVASESLTGIKETNIEQVYAWNPDKIFITNFNDAIPDDLYTNTLCNADWSQLDAVKKQEVHKLPLGMYRWYVTCSDSPLMLLWMAMENHPDRFADVDFNQTMKDFYKQFYDFDLTDEDIELIMKPIREAAGGI